MKKVLVLVFSIVICFTIRLYGQEVQTMNADGTAAGGIITKDAGGTATIAGEAGTADGVCLNSDGSICGPFGNLVQKCTSGISAGLFCGMMVLTAAQIVQDLTASNKAKDVANQTQCTGSFCGGGSNPPPPGFSFNNPSVTSNDPGLSPGQNQQLKAAEKALRIGADQGYTYNPSTNSVNTPSGAVPAGSYATADGLKKLGAPDSLVKSLEQATRGKSGPGVIGYDDGGGAGGRKPRGGGYQGSSFDMNAYMRSLMNNQNAQRSVAGLQVQAGTDNIGVKGDNIFDMITRSYHSQQPSLDQSY